MDDFELAQFATLLKLGYSVPECAEELGRHKSSLYALLKANGIPYGTLKKRYVGGKGGDRSLFRTEGKRAVRFDPRAVHAKRTRRKSAASSRCWRIENASPLALFVERKVRKRWSPEQISGRWNLETGEKLSKDTIYRYVHSNRPEWIRKYFRRKWRKYVRHRGREALRILDRKNIGLRPTEAEGREVFGHWEGDTVVGVRGSSPRLLTVVERKTGFLLSERLPDGKSGSVLEAFAGLPSAKKRLLRTVTFDNGGEFALHSLIEWETGTRAYFANPYRSCERATNENTNGLLRQYFPKRTDFSKVSEKELRKAVAEINLRPRKRLSFKTPLEALKEELLKSRKSV